MKFESFIHNQLAKINSREQYNNCISARITNWFGGIMLAWAAIGVFGFSIGLMWLNAVKKKNERIKKLRDIQSKIRANESSKLSASAATKTNDEADT